MSRFYDAMKRAGQSFPSGQGKASLEDFSFLEEDQTKVEEVLTRPENFSPQQPDSPPAEESSLVTSEAKLLEFRSVRKNGDFGTPVQGTLNGKTRVIPNIPDSAVVEQYRLLRTKLLQQKQEKMFKSLLITSPGPQEGKTVTTLNLALTLGLLPGFKVLVVEGDLRKGSIAEVLRVGVLPGLSDVIAGSATLDEATLRPEGVPVSFIIRGNSCQSPGELLHSPRFPTLMQELVHTFDLVLVDSPPVNIVTDAQLLASYCDGVLLIARAFSTSYRALEEATQILASSRLIGTILNGGTKLSSYYRYGSYY